MFASVNIHVVEWTSWGTVSHRCRESADANILVYLLYFDFLKPKLQPLKMSGYKENVFVINSMAPSLIKWQCFVFLYNDEHSGSNL